MHHFTIKKGSNHYGLFFGSRHSFGIEKFLKVCWKKNLLSGESTDNSNDDFEEGTLFHNLNTSNKKEAIKTIIAEKNQNGETSYNLTGLKYALSQLCLPKLFTQIVLELEKRVKIRRFGDVNNISTGIHKIKKYTIEVLK